MKEGGDKDSGFNFSKQSLQNCSVVEDKAVTAFRVNVMAVVEISARMVPLFEAGEFFEEGRG